MNCLLGLCGSNAITELDEEADEYKAKQEHHAQIAIQAFVYMHIAANDPKLRAWLAVVSIGWRRMS